MKHLILIAGMLAHAIPLLSQGLWEEKQLSPFVSASYQAFGANGNIYIVGRDIGLNYSNEVWEYNPLTDRWTEKADFPGNKRVYGVGFELNGYGYIVTGTQFGHPPDSNALWQYDPATDSWTKKADFPGVARTQAFGFSLNGKAYVGGGRVYPKDQTGVYAATDFWEYDPVADSWTQRADIPLVSRGVHSTAFADDQYGYAGLGALSKIGDFWRYDPAGDVWSPIASFPDSSIYMASGCFVGGKRYVIGGALNYADNFGKKHKKSYVYDPVEDRWDLIAPVHTDYNTVGHAFNLNGELYYYAGMVDEKQNVSSRVYHLNLAATDVEQSVQSGDMIKVFPTPFDGVLHLQSTSEIEEVTMYSAAGEEVRSLKLRGYTCELAGDQLVPGAYFIRVRTADNREVTIRTIHGR